MSGGKSKSLGDNFIHLGLYDAIYMVSFTLSKRKYIHDFIAAVDDDQEFKKDVRMYFVLQKLFLKTSKVPDPTFIAVF